MKETNLHIGSKIKEVFIYPRPPKTLQRTEMKDYRDQLDAKRVHDLWLNDPGRHVFINEIVRLYQIAPLKRVIVSGNTTKTEIREDFQSYIDRINKELSEYEETLKAKLNKLYPNVSFDYLSTSNK